MTAAKQNWIRVLLCYIIEKETKTNCCVCEDWVEGSGYGIFCGCVGSESILVRVQARQDVVFDVLENQFLKYCVGFVFLTLQYRLHVIVSDLCPCIVVLIWCPVECCKIQAEYQEFQELLIHTNCYLWAEYSFNRPWDEGSTLVSQIPPLWITGQITDDMFIWRCAAYPKSWWPTSNYPAAV